MYLKRLREGFPARYDPTFVQVDFLFQSPLLVSGTGTEASSHLYNLVIRGIDSLSGDEILLFLDKGRTFSG